MGVNGTTISNGNGFNNKFFVIILICLLLVMWSKLFVFGLFYLLIGYGLIVKRYGQEIADNMGISILWWPKIYFDND